MVRHLIAYVVPLLTVVVAIPLVLGKVPPNGAYGFRTERTLASQDVWYPANRAAGWFLIAAAATSMCFNVALSWTFPEWPAIRMLVWMTGGNAVALSIGLLGALVYLRRL